MTVTILDDTNPVFEINNVCKKIRSIYSLLLPRQCDKHMTPKLKRASNFNSHVFAPGIS
jgi:hypothetical protein